MGKHIHGGNVYKYADCIDFSANCNPLGTPESVIRAGRESLNKVSDYPEVGYLPLRAAIAEYERRMSNPPFQMHGALSGGNGECSCQVGISKPHLTSCVAACVHEEAAKADQVPLGYSERPLYCESGVKPDQVICGNGAAELIFTLCRALSPKHALLLAPTFAEYQQALESVGCELTYHYLLEENGFRLQQDFLEKLTKEVDVVFLCNPNNPTGILTEKAFMLQVLERCRENQIFLVVDECFQDFIRQPERYTLKAKLHTCDNLFLLKAFTKRYAMAGIRLGYGLTGNEVLLEQMERCVQPWNISTIAQACGMAALQENEYVERGRRIIFQERDYLKNEMSRLGLKVYDSRANYLFFHGPYDLFERCIQKKILIRDCSNYEGLMPGYYRIAVKLHEDNVRLIQALQEVLS